MKETRHGIYYYESDGYSASEQPDMNEYMVYLNDNDVGSIQLHYRTSETYSMRHGGNHERNERQMWTFQIFSDEFAQIPTDEEIIYGTSSYWTSSKKVTHPIGFTHPSDAITAMFAPKRFHNIRGALKHFIALYTAWLDREVAE